MKKIVILIFVALICGMVLGCAGKEKESERVTIRIATMGLIDGETIAYQEKYLEKYIDADIEFIKFDQSRDVVTALASGSVDIGECGSVGVATALSQGVDAKVIWIQDVLGDTDGLAVKASQNINSVEDLSGKTVGVTFGSTTQYSLLRTMSYKGVDVSSVNIVDMAVSEIPAAWEAGQIDAAYLWEPTLSNLKDSKLLLTSRDVASYGYPTMDITMVRSEFAEEHPELVIGYTNAVNEAVKLYENEPSVAATSVATALELDPENTLVLMNSNIWLNANAQISEEYMGTAEKKGKVVDYLYDTALFLYEQNSISEMPDRSVFEEGLAPEFAEESAKQ